ncbi:MAG: hypothetical protein JKX75_02100 [Gammaproteobacteria bacterium]|nr:hypothetical protein [Gammaproteobacteria bacterium]
MMWSGFLLLIILISAYLRLPLLVWSLLFAAGVTLTTIFSDFSSTQTSLM